MAPSLPAAARGAGGPAVNAPSNLGASATSTSSIAVSWQDNATNESGFEVHRSLNGANGTFTMLATTAASVTAFDDGGLTPATQYCYRLRAFRNVGSNTSFSSFSSTACATTPVPPPPPPPAAPSAVGARPLGSSTIQISWTDNAMNEDGFRLERSTDDGISWTTAGTSAASPYAWGFFGDTGRTSEQRACYRVVAFNAAGESPPSNTACTTPPAAPTNLTVTMLDEQAWRVAWTDNSDVEDGYELWISDYDGYCSFIYSLPPNTTHLDFGGSDLPGTGCAAGIRVVATKDGGWSDGAFWPSDPAGSAPGSTASAPTMSSPQVRLKP
ncbi:MAG TPA: fibronectin type III domain-containing protein [Gemmatimonadales bacterium]|nr:fibronectin type III domain-containing protein [Gemmatimonadales bacterium]